MATKVIITSLSGEVKEIELNGEYSRSDLTITVTKCIPLAMINKLDIATIYLLQGKIPAIKKVRELTNCGLKEAKDWCETCVGALPMNCVLKNVNANTNQWASFDSKAFNISIDAYATLKYAVESIGKIGE